MRISYLDRDIYLAFINISSCFRFPHICPDLIGAFGFLIGTLHFASNAMVFGSIVLASFWEPFQVAIGAIATSYYFKKTASVKTQTLAGHDHMGYREVSYPLFSPSYSMLKKKQRHCHTG